MFTVSAQRVNIFAESYEQPVQFMVRGDLKNMEYNLPPIIHMYRPFLMVVHLRSLLIFGSSKKSVCHFVFGLLTQISLNILRSKRRVRKKQKKRMEWMDKDGLVSATVKEAMAELEANVQ